MVRKLVYLFIYNKLLNSGPDDSIDVAAIDVVAIGIVAVDVVAIFVVAIDVVGVVAKDFGFIPPANVVLKQFMWHPKKANGDGPLWTKISCLFFYRGQQTSFVLKEDLDKSKSAKK